MMSEVMRLTTFFATLAVTSLFATSVALAAAGATNTTGIPLVASISSAVAPAKIKPPSTTALHSRRAASTSAKPI
jgi:hypothetical protein